MAFIWTRGRLCSMTVPVTAAIVPVAVVALAIRSSCAADAGRRAPAPVEGTTDTGR